MPYYKTFFKYCQMVYTEIMLGGRTERRRQLFRSIEAKSLRSRSLLTQISDDLTSICGSTPFLIFHIVFFTGWILLNTEAIPGTIAFDPFPFGLLTMVVSLEAIFLAIFILVSQNRSSYVNTIREEVHMRINMIAEEEITKVLELLAELRKKLGVKDTDPELEEMLKRIDTNYIEQSVIDQLERANIPIPRKIKEDFSDLLVAPIKKPLEMIQQISTNGPATTPVPATKKDH